MDSSQIVMGVMLAYIVFELVHPPKPRFPGRNSWYAKRARRDNKLLRRQGVAPLYTDGEMEDLGWKRPTDD